VADDGRALLFRPDRAFARGERVDVALTGPRVEAARTWFEITAGPAPALRAEQLVELGEAADADPLWHVMSRATLPSNPVAASNSSTADYPIVTTVVSGTPAAGSLFMASFATGGVGSPYLLILDDTGAPLFYRQMSSTCTDFKLQPNGQLTYFDSGALKFYALNAGYAVVDSFACGNGYLTDVHDLRILPNGHALLFGLDPEPVNMSFVVPGGNPNATVLGMIIQELDSEKNVVFEWRTWDHFQITDATHENLLASVIDYVHSNAIDVDRDGNLLVSSRHLDEITKIDHETVATLWRWGGKNNQFQMNDPEGPFSHQHAIRRIANGDVTLFDNGDFRAPPYSRASEYALDEVNKVATLVWEFRNTPDSYGNAMGYVQRLDNGSTLVGFGTGDPDAIEVDANGNKVLEASLPAGFSIYRTLRQEWNPDLTAVPRAPGPRAAVTLSPGAPNPSRDRTSLYLRLAHETTVSLAVVDVGGRVVRQILDGAVRPAGVSRVAVDLTGAPAGVYFARAVTSAGAVSRRLVHLP